MSKSSSYITIAIIKGYFHKVGAHFVTFLVSLLHMKPTCVFVALGKTQMVE